MPELSSHRTERSSEGDPGELAAQERYLAARPLSADVARRAADNQERVRRDLAQRLADLDYTERRDVLAHADRLAEAAYAPEV